MDRVPSQRGMVVRIGACAHVRKVPGLLFPLPSCGHKEYMRDGTDSSYHVSEVTDRLRTSEKKAVFVNYPHQRNAIA